MHFLHLFVVSHQPEPYEFGFDFLAISAEAYHFLIRKKVLQENGSSS